MLQPRSPLLTFTVRLRRPHLKSPTSALTNATFEPQAAAKKLFASRRAPRKEVNGIFKRWDRPATIPATPAGVFLARHSEQNCEFVCDRNSSVIYSSLTGLVLTTADLAPLPRDAFDDEELLTLLKQPLFTGCKNRIHDRYVTKPTTLFSGDGGLVSTAADYGAFLLDAGRWSLPNGRPRPGDQSVGVFSVSAIMMSSLRNPASTARAAMD